MKPRRLAQTYAAARKLACTWMPATHVVPVSAAGARQLARLRRAVQRLAESEGMCPMLHDFLGGLLRGCAAAARHAAPERERANGPCSISFITSVKYALRRKCTQPCSAWARMQSCCPTVKCGRYIALDQTAVHKPGERADWASLGERGRAGMDHKAWQPEPRQGHRGV